MNDTEKEAKRRSLLSAIQNCERYVSALDTLTANRYHEQAALLLPRALLSTANLVLQLNDAAEARDLPEAAEMLDATSAKGALSVARRDLVNLIREHRSDLMQPASPQALKSLFMAVDACRSCYRSLTRGPLHTARDTRNMLCKFVVAGLAIVIVVLSITLARQRNEARRAAFIESPSGRAVKDLVAIKAALDRYHADHGSYPQTKGGWDGFLSCKGESRPDWIQGLAPAYIEELPRDPRHSKDCSWQYHYRSDGENFKIIAHQGLATGDVLLFYPEMIDPMRPTYAYGFWTRRFKWK